ncbi:hypothetical protein AX16_002567 [Volvariella volvacea WC 439]|nr:hypothetical protein AX16_002567 [Volvariella volvacea WC 439]
MPTLDTRGIIAATQIAAYVPIATVSLFFVVRYGFRRDAGWIFLSLFSLVRVTGGALIVSGQLVEPTQSNLSLAAYILQPSGLAFLLLSTIGFTGLAGYRSYSDVARLMIFFRTFGFFCLIALILNVVGGVLGSEVSPNTATVGAILRQAGACLYAAIWLLLFLLILGLWTYRYHMKRYRRWLLAGITLAQPILGARAAYAVLSAWSSTDLAGTDLSINPILARFNPYTGDWMLYLVLSFVAEVLVAIAYVISAAVIARRR